MPGLLEGIDIFLFQAGPLYGCCHQAGGSRFAVQPPDRLQNNPSTKAVAGEGKACCLPQFKIAEGRQFLAGKVRRRLLHRVADEARMGIARP
ncbi:hypothetical protein D3C87_1760580 [compost metagenome]